MITEVEEGGAVPMHLQGDLEMYSAFHLNARAKLRKDPQVIAALDQWWEVVVNSLVASGQMVDRDGDGTVDAEIDKREYVRISRCLFKALMPEWDEEEAQSSAEDDWDSDSKGAATLGRRDFLDSIFQARGAAPLPPRSRSRPAPAPGPLPARSRPAPGPPAFDGGATRDALPPPHALAA